MEQQIAWIVIAASSATIAGVVVSLGMRIRKSLDRLDPILMNIDSVVGDVRRAKDSVKYGTMEKVVWVMNLISKLKGGEK